ncbi:hypothetical protein KAOT1_14387 [Kordia algicida OT-1]|uniref:DUF4271 domain-containing protein n=1 Tax=Kordia algicida OT-1 TaxID=391587 RepID=A9DKW0_9FLAO|nr:hypothetical protein KAOT1_14387 [Kordia algicida OT-1]
MFQTVERTVISKDWLTLLFLVTLCLLVVTRFVFRKKFGLFLVFLFSNKYQNLTESKQEAIINGFTTLLFVVQLISFSIFAYVALTFFHPQLVSTPLLFVKIISFMVFFILIKYIIEKIIAVILDIESYINTYNFHKINARNLFGLLLIPINLVLVYYDYENKIVFFSIFFTFLSYNLIVLFLLLKNYQKLIISKLFYFILYLCALEIAPYLVIYKFLIK